ncbi:hypothetical protein [Nocardioides coralli]|uniref:hypothetical protein n=1 Tax=Nocardioides coralli TaxID=2872154 RepID=UPI001CA4540C|nr:hypothetical protein [Nocardioides coralli]QZY29245.1 hypothetical protein K6T13_00510 [Nocardioides coralli]
MSRRVLLHVGTPKTGTSHLQDVLFRNRERLKDQGILYAADRFDAHFLAALDLMQLPWGGLEDEAVGAWDRLAERVRDFDGTAIISHEILATASHNQAKRALASLGHPEAEVHVVLSVRDLVRQIPAEWQENVKHRRELPYAQFLAQIRDPARESAIGAWFWGVQEVPNILDRWAGDLPPERVHLVTVPPVGGRRELLWERFSSTFGLSGLELDVEAERANPSLGAAETTLVRRINVKANKIVPPSAYRPLVRELLAHQTLSHRTGSPRLTLPPADHAWVAERQAEWTRLVRERGYDVVGDLDDLVGPPPVVEWADPDQPDEALVADAGVDAVAALLVENARLLRAEHDLRGALDAAHAELERAYLRPTYRWREKTVRRLQGGRVGRTLLRVYRAVRGRSSRSA